MLRRRVSEDPEYSWGWVFHQENEPHRPRLCTAAALDALEKLNLLLANPEPVALRGRLVRPERPASAFLALAHAAGCPEVHTILFNAYREASNDGLVPHNVIPFVNLMAVSRVLEESALVYAAPLSARERQRVVAALDRLRIG